MRKKQRQRGTDRQTAERAKGLFKTHLFTTTLSVNFGNEQTSGRKKGKNLSKILWSFYNIFEIIFQRKRRRRVMS